MLDNTLRWPLQGTIGISLLVLLVSYHVILDRASSKIVNELDLFLAVAGNMRPRRRKVEASWEIFIYTLQYLLVFIDGLIDIICHDLHLF